MSEEPLSKKTFDIAPEISSWLRTTAITFNTTKPNAGFDDLMPLKEIIGNARIVALGEATHGTHEFFQMKHRMLEFLVKEMKFNIFAIEASWSEANLLNNYVHTGQGDPAELLAKLGFWIWNTQEVLDMIRWMRIYNENTGDAPAVSFLGFDVQFPWMAMEQVVEYLKQVDVAMVEQANASYKCFRKYSGKVTKYAELPAESRAECRNALQALYDHLKQQQATYEAQSSTQAFAFALQSARVIVQAADMWSRFGKERNIVRDRYMADNVAWLLEQLEPESKVVLWAHNDHVGVIPEKSMGWHLRERYGDEMVSLGFSFYSGVFNALHNNSGYAGKMAQFQIIEPPEDSHETYLHSANLPHFFLDLRNIPPDSSAAKWLLISHPFRYDIGWGYDESKQHAYFRSVTLPQMFDAIIHFENTTPSLLLEHGHDKPVQPVDTQPTNLNFEMGVSGWKLHESHPEEYEIGTNTNIVYSSTTSGYIRSAKDTTIGFGTLMQTITARKYRGQRLRLSAYVKTEYVMENAGLWMRVDASTGIVSFDNMENRPILGNTDWTYYEIILDVPEVSVNIAFGVLLSGRGQVWVDNFQLESVDHNIPTTG